MIGMRDIAINEAKTVRLILTLLALAPFLTSCLFAPQPFDESSWRMQVARSDPADLYLPHEENGVFYNPWMVGEKGRFTQFLKWRLTQKADYTEQEETYLPETESGILQRIDEIPQDQDFLVWIGHATFLIRLSGAYWLTDPMLSNRALLPARLTPPALNLKDLANLSGPLNVIISHNHYDHLDKASLQALPSHARVFVPTGLKEYVASCHDGEVLELDWWEQFRQEDVLLTSLPAQHWSRRIGQGRNSTLWASYMLQSSKVTVYFGGDSGYFVGYQEFGRTFEQIDYALLPITAYQPRWFMHYPHMNVEEAIQAFTDLQAHFFVPTQWGTFRLGENPPGYPMLDLERHIYANGLDQERYIRPHLGEVILLSR
jgi:L-ascorbate metabolism protein UlaG (beta-lactamase superfamily)